MELGYFDKHSPTTQEIKVTQGKNLRFFCLETLKNCILMKTLPIDDRNQAIFFLKLGHFFPIFEKGQGRPPPPSPL